MDNQLQQLDDNMENTQPIFINGFYSNDVPENAPEWILGKGSLHVGKLMEWLINNQFRVNESGYINYIIKRNKKDGKRFVSVDTWKKPTTERTYQPEDFPISTQPDPFYDPTVPPAPSFPDGQPF